MDGRAGPGVALARLAVLALVLGGCRRDHTAPGESGSSMSGGSADRSARPPASTASAPATAPGAPPRATPEPDEAGLVPIELGAAGDGWTGLVGRAPAGSAVRSDGLAAAAIELPDRRSIVLIPGGPRGVAEQRLGATNAAHATGATLTFETDAAGEIAYVLDLVDIDGAPLRTHGFAVARDVGGSRFVCAFSSANDEAQLAAARAVCDSITR